MTETQTRTGGCHCGNVRYEVTLALDPVIACNCSICTKRGHLLSFTTPDNFKLLSGGHGLTDYQFNKHVIHHLFCPTCGVGSFARASGQTARRWSPSMCAVSTASISPR